MASDGHSSEAMETGQRRRKVKNRILHLTELIPDVAFQTVGQYGVGDNSVYVMETEVDGKIFQGIGPSKKRAKAMAADFALVHLEVLDEVEEHPPDIRDWIDYPADFTADIADTSCTQLYYDFNAPEVEEDVQGVTYDEDDEDDDDILYKVDDLTMQMLGKNPLTILGEMRLNTSYTLLDESGDPLHPKFLIRLQIDEHTFQGCGSSKKLAKGRAARDALGKMYNLEFGTSENGMPIYEGDARLWQHYKAKLERRAERHLNANRDPVRVLQELFPEIRYTYINPPKQPGETARQHVMRISIFDEVYESFGKDKNDAKKNAAAKTLTALKQNGVIAGREREIEADRKAAITQPRIPSLLELDKKSIPVQRNAVAKLNIAYPNSEYVLIAETPVENTLLMAFTMAVKVDGRSFVGVGKTKKTAKMEAAEKALRFQGLWTKDDETAKQQALAEDDDPAASISKYRENFEAKKARSLMGPWQGGAEGPGGWGGDSWGPSPDEWVGNRMGWNDWNGGFMDRGGPPQWIGPRGPFPNDFGVNEPGPFHPPFGDFGRGNSINRGFNGNLGGRGNMNGNNFSRIPAPPPPPPLSMGINTPGRITPQSGAGGRGIPGATPAKFPVNNKKSSGESSVTSFDARSYSSSAETSQSKRDTASAKQQTTGNFRSSNLPPPRFPTTSSGKPSSTTVTKPGGVKTLSAPLSNLINRSSSGGNASQLGNFQQPKSILKNPLTFGSSGGYVDASESARQMQAVSSSSQLYYQAGAAPTAGNYSNLAANQMAMPGSTSLSYSAGSFAGAGAQSAAASFSDNAYMGGATYGAGYYSGYGGGTFGQVQGYGYGTFDATVGYNGQSMYGTAANSTDYYGSYEYGNSNMASAANSYAAQATDNNSQAKGVW